MRNLFAKRLFPLVTLFQSFVLVVLTLIPVFGLADDSLFPGEPFGLNAELSELESGDFNGDGFRDLVAVSQFDDFISILLGNGDGSFDSQQTITFDNPRDLKISDFNGDGDSDFAVANSSEIFIYLGDGEGSFSQSTSFAFSNFLRCFEPADMNADGFFDVVVVSSTGVSVHLGSADGTFEGLELNLFEDVQLSSSLSINDINDDGHLDAVLGGRSFPDSFALVLPGIGDGTFADAQQFLLGALPTQVTAADVNSDGIVDIIATVSFDAFYSILIGTGGGGFEPVQTANAFENRFNRFEIVDLNNDGIQEIVVTTGNFLPPRIIEVQQLNGTDLVVLQSLDFDSSIEDFVIDDFNNDGNLDLSLGLEIGFRDGFIVPLFGDDDATLSAVNSFPSAGIRGRLAVGDIDADGLDDVLVASANEDSVFFQANLGGALSGPIQFATCDGPRTVGVGDFNNDGFLDLVTPNRSDNVSVLEGINGMFGANVEFTVGDGPQDVATGDFDGDGNLDIVTPNIFTDDISILLGNGDLTFAPAVSMPTGDAPFRVATTNVNSDDFLDLLVMNLGADNTITVLSGNGDGTFVQQNEIILEPGFREIEVFDANVDGNIDFALLNTVTRQIAIYLGGGDGSFVAGPETLSIDRDFPFFVVSDLTQDGTPDIAFIEEDDSQFVRVHTGNGDGTFELRSFLIEEFDSSDIGVGDFNGDGAPDLAIFNEDDSEIVILTNFENRTFFEPNALDVFRGDAITGGLEDIVGSDNLQLIVQQGFVLNATEAPVWLILDGTLPSAVDELNMTTESQAGTPNLQLTIEAFNWNTSEYEVVAVRNEQFNQDARRVINLSSGLSDFVDSGLNVRTRLGWRAVGFTINFPWQVRLDQAAWSN